MKFGCYTFHCQLDSDAILPAYKGSTFRGGFGHAFKRAVCSVRSRHCPQCLLAGRCLYIKVFEQAKGWATDVTAEAGKRLVSPPLPYVIEPDLTLQTHYKSGDAFDFKLLLFGEANDFLPYFIYAVELMGKAGIGRKMTSQRAGFHIVTVTSSEQVIYDGNEPRLAADRHLETLALDDTQADRITTLGLRLETPLRLKHQNHLQCELPFHLLVRAALRRVSALFAHYGDGEPELDYRGLVERAQAVSIRDSSLGWFDWKRYSARQEAEMLMGGMSGTVIYQGELAEFLPLLALGAKLHLGKATTFGLGKFAIEAG